jgi:hypothetical protein
MELENSLPYSQNSAAGPYPKAVESSPYSLNLVFYDAFLSLSRLRLSIPGGLFIQVFR